MPVTTWIITFVIRNASWFGGRSKAWLGNRQDCPWAAECLTAHYWRSKQYPQQGVGSTENPEFCRGIYLRPLVKNYPPQRLVFYLVSYVFFLQANKVGWCTTMIQRRNELFVWLWSSTADTPGCKHHLGQLDSCWPRSVDRVWALFVIQACYKFRWLINDHSLLKYQSTDTNAINQASVKPPRPPLVGISKPGLLRSFCCAWLGQLLGLDWVGWIIEGWGSGSQQKSWTWTVSDVSLVMSYIFVFHFFFFFFNFCLPKRKGTNGRERYL